MPSFFKKNKINHPSIFVAFSDVPYVAAVKQRLWHSASNYNRSRVSLCIIAHNITSFRQATDVSRPLKQNTFSKRHSLKPRLEHYKQASRSDFKTIDRAVTKKSLRDQLRFRRNLSNDRGNRLDELYVQVIYNKPRAQRARRDLQSYTGIHIHVITNTGKFRWGIYRSLE